MEELKYCPACQKVSKEDKCAFCEGEGRELLEEDKVFLVTADPEAFGFIKEDFGRAGIKFTAEERPLPPDGSVYSGKGMLVQKDIYVSGKDYLRSEKVLAETFKNIEEMEQMPKGKRIAVQVASVFGFIVLVYLVIYGADFIVELVKGLF